MHLIEDQAQALQRSFGDTTDTNSDSFPVLSKVGPNGYCSNDCDSDSQRDRRGARPSLRRVNGGAEARYEEIRRRILD